MDDEVFVRVTYEPRDFIAARRLGLLARLRETNAFQLAGFLALAGAGIYFFAPEGIGRFFASAAGALVIMLLLLFAFGWTRAAMVPAPETAELSMEISADGLVLKHEDRYARFPFRAFRHITYGQGVFAFIGDTTIVVPARTLRPDQIAAVRAIVRASESSLGDGTPAAPEKNNAGDRGGERKTGD